MIQKKVYKVKFDTLFWKSSIFLRGTKNRALFFYDFIFLCFFKNVGLGLFLTIHACHAHISLISVAISLAGSQHIRVMAPDAAQGQ